MVAKIAATCELNIQSTWLGTLAASVVMVSGAAVVGRFEMSGLPKMTPGVGAVAGAAISGSTAAVLTGARPRLDEHLRAVLVSGSNEIQVCEQLKQFGPRFKRHEREEQLTAEAVPTRQPTGRLTTQRGQR